MGAGIHPEMTVENTLQTKSTKREDIYVYLLMSYLTDKITNFSFILKVFTLCVSGRAICAVVITWLLFSWCYSHISVSSTMITDSHGSQNAIADERGFYFSLSSVFILVIHSYVYMSKCNIKTRPDAQELDNFTARFFRRICQSQYQLELNQIKSWFRS